LNKTIDELETEYLQLRHAREYGTNKFLFDTDHKWRHETEAALVKLTAAKEAAAKPAPAPNTEDLALLQRAMAIDNGRRYFNDQKMRESIFDQQVKVLSGERIPEAVRAATEASITQSEAGQ
jgi:hypothetical protein